MKQVPSGLLPHSRCRLHVSLALTGEDRHGYGITLATARKFGSPYWIGLGNLYNNLKRPLKLGFFDGRLAVADDLHRCHITDHGNDVLSAKPSTVIPIEGSAPRPAPSRGEGIMTSMPCLIYTAIDALPTSAFRNRYSLEVLLDFDTARATRRVANFYLKALQSIVRRRASRLFPRSLGVQSVFATTIILAVAAPVKAQSKHEALSFDVVSVRPSDPSKEHEAMYWRQPDGLKWDGVTLTGMIANAYSIGRTAKGQIESGPAWMSSQAFDINAKVDAETAARWNKMTQSQADEERRAMTRSLLTDRFHFRFHHETRKLPVFVLRVAKSGSKLQHPHPQNNLPAGVPVSRINFPGDGRMDGHSALMSNLVKSLASEPEIAGRTLLDKTGLTGGYDFTLRWTPDTLASGAGPTDSDTQWPSLFTALKEQLGLNLAPEKQPIDIIVVDSVEMPSEN